MRQTLIRFFCILLLCPKAYSHSAARPIDMLCGTNVVLIGKVLGATPTDCRIRLKERNSQAIDCEPKDGIELLVSVAQVLGRKNSETDVLAEAPYAAGKTITLKSSLSEISARPPLEKPMTNEEALHLFEKEPLIFSIHMGKDQPYFTWIWKIGQLNWVSEVLNKGDGISCPKP